MDIHFEIDPASLQSLTNLMHAPFDCPFCTEWTVCGACNPIEATALNWLIHMIDKHHDEIGAARVVALAGGFDSAYKYFHQRLHEVVAKREAEKTAANEPAAAEQETTETADASGD